LRPGDLAASGVVGLRSRKARSAFTAAGISIGIAALVAVVGVSQSSKADLIAELDRLGTDLLTVQAGQSFMGDTVTLPPESSAMIRRIPPVTGASAVTIADATVRRSDLIPEAETGGISVQAAEPGLLNTLAGTVARGRFLDELPGELPNVVLGSVAAERLGIGDLANAPMVFIGGHWFNVVGILDPMTLHPEIDRSALIGYEVAAELFDTRRSPTTIYLRTVPEQTEAVRAVVARTANPQAPAEVSVSRPSDALEARAAVDEGLTRLLLGLGAVALLVGGLGIANIMVISVLERRTEIGVRRALGAARRHIAAQFMIESSLLSAIGGTIGVALGAAVTAGYATRQGWIVEIPQAALAAGVAVALVVGVAAGLHPALKAARVDPADAVRPRT
jgi:putative ABC transport system permease protein